MTKSFRALIALGLSVCFIWSMAVRSDASEGHDKESGADKPASGSSHAPAASESQPAPAKPSSDVKPPPAAPKAKGELTTEHKENITEKPASGSSHAPIPPDSQPVPKPAVDTRPQSQAAPSSKSEASTEHKEDRSEKPAPAKPSPEVKPPPATPKAKEEVATEHKEETTEKSAPAKPAPEAKPQSTTTPTPKTEAAPDHKEVVPKKPAPDGQSVQPKPAPEAKPPTPAVPKAKGEAATEHKDGGSDKSTPTKPTPEAKPQPPTAPVMKADLPPDPEVKDKEPALRKTLGSLILSVKLALMGDSKLFHYEIEVEDDQQTVTLSGRVSTEEEKVIANEVAQKVPGVKNVINKLAVEKDLARTLSKKQDDALTVLIKERFAKSATLKAANFDVKTEDGVVLLDGTVRFQVIALEAAEAARQVPGVRAVNTERVRLEGES